MIFDPEWTPHREPSCAWNSLGDQTVIVHPRRGTVTQINATGAEIWEMCDGRTPVRRMIDAIGKRYEAEPRLIEQTVQEFLGSVVAQQLVAGAAGSATASEPSGSTLFAGLLERAMRETVPLTAQILVTERCDQECVHCYLPAPRSREELTLRELDDLLGQLRQAGTLFVIVSGGEPTVRADFLEILALVRDHHLALRLYTNGKNIDPTLARAIAGFHAVSVDISLYGSTAATHELISRTPGSFARTVGAIRELCGLGLRVTVKMPITRFNAADHAATRQLVETLGAEMAETSAYLFAPRRDPAALEALAASDAALAPLLAQDAATGCEGEPRPGPGLCGAGNSYVHIGSDGRVFPCPLFTEPVGSIREQPFIEIWRGAPFLQALRALSFADLPECRRCAAASLCGRCTAAAYSATHELTAADAASCRIADFDLIKGQGATDMEKEPPSDERDGRRGCRRGWSETKALRAAADRDDGEAAHAELHLPCGRLSGQQYGLPALGTVMKHSLHIDLLRELLERGQAVELVAHGPSMRPILDEGITVTVEAVSLESVAAGDLLAYWDGERIITHVLHFVLPVGGKTFVLLKGAANAHGDLPVEWESVLGRVTRVTAGQARVPAGARLDVSWTSLAAWSFLIPYTLRRCTRVVRQAAHVSLKGLLA